MPELAMDVEADDAEAQQYLSFMQGGVLYGLAILNIKEIIEYGEITEIPMTPEFISGVINLRGSILPVIDLNQRFSDKTTEITNRTSIIIIDVMDDDLSIEIGVTVDMVNEVLDIYPSNIESAPSLGKQIGTDFISGMAKIDEKLLILLDIANILSIDELSMVGNIQVDAF